MIRGAALVPRALPPLRLRAQRGRRPSETDAFDREFAPLHLGAGAGQVSLVNHEVEHVLDRAEPIAAPRREQTKRLARLPDLLFRAGDALGHARLAHQERPGDLRRR